MRGIIYMSLENIGGSFQPLVPERPGKKTTKGPDNYPAYGDKKPDETPEDIVALRSSRKKPAPAEKPLPETPPETEGPDNYPSYGDKSAPVKKETQALLPTQPEHKGEEKLALQDYYTLMDCPPSLTGGPDNYPSYGDKCSKPIAVNDRLLPLKFDEFFELGSSRAETQGPDNYPSYGDR
jgi:hypothetical protein